VYLLTPALRKNLQAARKEAVKAVLSNDATEETVKTKVDAVVKILGDVWMLQYSKGFKTIAKEVSNGQKNWLVN
jgi:hypothetical protein